QADRNGTATSVGVVITRQRRPRRNAPAWPEVSCTNMCRPSAPTSDTNADVPSRRTTSEPIRSSCVRAVYVASGTTGGCVSRDIAEPPWSRAVTSGGGHLGRRIQLDARRGAEIAGFFHARPTPPGAGRQVVLEFMAAAAAGAMRAAHRLDRGPPTRGHAPRRQRLIDPVQLADLLATAALAEHQQPERDLPAAPAQPLLPQLRLGHQAGRDGAPLPHRQALTEAVTPGPGPVPELNLMQRRAWHRCSPRPTQP